MKTRPLRFRVATGTFERLPLPDVRAAAGLARGVVERAQELGDEVDDADDLLLVPDVVAGGQAVDPRVEDLVADLLGDAEAAGGVLDVGDAVVDVVLLEDDGQGLLQDGAAGVAHHVPDQQDVHPDRLPAGRRPVKRPGWLWSRDLGYGYRHDDHVRPSSRSVRWLRRPRPLRRRFPAPRGTTALPSHSRAPQRAVRARQPGSPVEVAEARELSAPERSPGRSGAAVSPAIVTRSCPTEIAR